MSCHGPSLAPESGRSAGRGRSANSTLLAPMRLLLVGAPNVGKSTLFNALTGARQRTTNAPGTTVELATGTWRTAAPGTSDSPDSLVERSIVDLPGTYSLLARSADEQVSADAVRDLAEVTDRMQSSGELDDRADLPGVAIVVLDATALARSLYLLAQVAETGVPLVVALTMLDLAATVTDSPTAAIEPDTLAATLAEVLGVPVVPVDARNRADASRRDLARAVDEIVANPRRLNGIPAPNHSCCSEKAATAELSAPPDLVQEFAHAETLFAWVERTTEQVTRRIAHPATVRPARGANRKATAGGSRPSHRTFSDRIDTVLLNPWAGIPVFLAVVWLLFELTTRFAAPMQDLIDQFVNGPIATGVTGLLALVGLEESWIQGLLVDGLLAGVGTVLTFVPVMAVMFVALGVLEDCGYLARAAFVADRAMRVLGLDGRALLPLIVGFGCNLPPSRPPAPCRTPVNAC
jgi:ferrous iron transport protein B